MPNNKWLWCLFCGLILFGFLSGCSSVPTVTPQQIHIADSTEQRVRAGVYVSAENQSTRENFTNSVPGPWQATTLTSARYEVLVDDTQIEDGTCIYTANLGGGAQPVSHPFMRTDSQVVIIDLVENTELERTNFTGMKDQCPYTVSIVTDIIFGSANRDAFRAWLLPLLQGKPGINPTNIPYHEGGSFQISPDGKHFVMTPQVNPQDQGLCAIVRNIETLAMETLTYCDLETLKGNGQRAQFSPDGQRLLVQTSIVVGESAGEPSPDGQIQSAQMNNHTIVFDASTGEPSLSFLGMNGYFGARGGFILGYTDHSIQLRDYNTGDILREFTGFDAPISFAAVSANESRLITALTDGRVLVWDLTMGKSINVLDIPHKDGEDIGILAVDINFDGSRALATVINFHEPTIINDNQISVYVWSLENGNLLWQINDESRSGVATFSPDGKWILTMPADYSEPKILDASTGKSVLKLGLSFGEETYNSVTVNAPVFSPDGSRIYEMTEADLVFWDLTSSLPDE